MRYAHFFRWLLVGGLTLIASSLGIYAATPEYLEIQQIDLTVLDEKPDGQCTVRWMDPFEHRQREAPYLCDAERDPILKAPHYDTDSGHGWESGFVIVEGAGKGELHSLEQDEEVGERIGLSDALVTIGLLLTIVALVGGNVDAMNRGRGANPKVVRAATRLREAAALVAQDHGRAVEAVRTAWAPLHRELVDGELSRIPVARLPRMAGVRARAKDLEKGGVRTVRDVLDAGLWRLAQIPGVDDRLQGRSWPPPGGSPMRCTRRRRYGSMRGDPSRGPRHWSSLYGCWWRQGRRYGTRPRPAGN
ncbi:hypothetical protein ACR6C2_02340 [Streptomyces sp. INA 01156]